MDMILTFILEMNAMFPPTITWLICSAFVVGLTISFILGWFYVVVEIKEYCYCDCIYKCVTELLSKCSDCKDCTRVKNDCNKLMDKFLKPVFCTVFGPLLYYYGNNITKVVDLFGASNTTQGNITDNNALVLSDEWQSGLRASAVAALFAFILISNIDWQPNSDSKHLWGPVPDMLVKLVPLDAFYSTLLQVARINMISTPTMFCRGVDQAFFGAVFVIANIYAIYSIGRIVMKCNKYKWLVILFGVAIWFIFVAYLLADKLLPLNYCLCNVPVDDDVKMAAVMHYLHIARAALSIVCAACIVMLYVGSESVYEVRKLITQAQLVTQLENELNTLLNTNDNDRQNTKMAQSIVHSVAMSVAKSRAKVKVGQQCTPFKYSDFEIVMIEHSTEVAKLISKWFAALKLNMDANQWDNYENTQLVAAQLKLNAAVAVQLNVPPLNAAVPRNAAALQMNAVQLNTAAAAAAVLLNTVVQLKAAVVQLKAAVVQLNTAAAAAVQLNDAVVPLKDAVVPLNTAVVQLKDAAVPLNTAAAAAVQLNVASIPGKRPGIEAKLNDAVVQLNAAAVKLNAAAVQLNAAAVPLNAKVPLDAAADNLDAAADNLDAAVVQLNAVPLDDAADKLDAAVVQLNAVQLDDAADNLDAAADKLDAAADNLDAAADKLDAAADNLDAAAVQLNEQQLSQSNAFESMKTLMKKTVVI